MKGAEMQNQNFRSRFDRVLKMITPWFAMTIVFFIAANVANANPPNAPRTTAKAYVIVQFADRDLAARAITFTTPISGFHALQLTGLPFEYVDTGFGPAVCNINGVGCPSSNCFCDPNKFWNYNYWDGAAWQSYPVGAGSSSIGDGAAEGWRWADFSSGTAMQPARPVTAAVNALDWLKPGQSLADGGYGGDSGTAEAQLTIGASNYRARDWRRLPTSPSILSFQMLYGARFAKQGAAEAGKLAIAQIATNACFTPQTLLPSAYYNSSSGAYFAGAGPHSWAMLGTAALSQTVPANSKLYLKSLAQPNGAWEWAPGWGTDTNSTALAIQALIATGEITSSSYITKGLAYLKSAQNSDGGFPYDPASIFDTASDADSTAYVVQAILAAGQNPTIAPWLAGSNHPIGYLLSLQLPDGSFEWQSGTGSNQLATGQAAVALLGRPFPLRVAAPSACSVNYFPLINR
jgi:hypothetical protein